MKNIFNVSGSSGGGGGGGGDSRIPYESPNDLRTKAVSRGLGVLCEGEIVGLVDGAKSIYFDDSSLEDEYGDLNFEGVNYWERLGTPDQDYIPGFPMVNSETNVNADVTNETPVMRTITNTDVDAVRVRVQLPQGLMIQRDNGDLSPYSVQVAIDVRSSGGDWAERVNNTIEGKTTSPYERSYRIGLTGNAPWDIRVRRVSADNESSKIRDKTAFSAFTEIIDTKLIYPDTAVMGLAIDAEKFGNSVPTVSFEIKGLKVLIPSNYDPVTREYAGIWDGTFQKAWTDNPAWCIYDLLTEDRYGLGVDTPDKWALYEIAQYCDELVSDGYGGTEPRFRLNCVLQTREDAYHTINSLISACLGLCFWGAGGVTFSQDKPDTPTHYANPSNVENGEFQYEGTSIRARHTAALVTWNDPDDAYKPAVEVVEHQAGISRFGFQPTDVVAIGCKYRGQAHRFGKWILDSEQNETDTVGFVGGLEFADAQPGNLVEVSDPVVLGVRMAGRIKSATATIIELDAPVTIEEGEGYTLTVVMPDKTSEDATVTNMPGEVDVLTLASALSQTPDKGALWSITATNVTPRLFRILSNRETAPHKYEIAGIERDPGKFARVEQGIQLDALGVSLIPTGKPPVPTNLLVDEFLYTSGESFMPGTIFSWSHADDGRVVRYDVQIKRPDGEWESHSTVATPSVVITNTTAGTYSFRVRSLTRLGSSSKWLTMENKILLGLNQPPNDVTGLVFVVQTNGGVIAWDAVEDWRSVQYEARKGLAWDTGQVIGVTSELSMDTAGDGTYQVRAKVGNAYSDNSALVVVDGGTIVANVIASHDEDAEGWPGILGGDAVINNGDITLSGSTGEGSYQIPTAHIISLSATALCNVQFDYTLYGSGADDDVYAITDIYGISDIYGDYGQYVSATPQIRLYNNAAWGEWQRFVPGRYAAEKYDFRILLSSSQADVAPLLTEMKVAVDVPDRVESKNGLSIGTGGESVAFGSDFNAAPSVVGSIVSALGGEDIVFENITASGFDVSVTSGGVNVARIINFVAQGY